MRIVRPLAWCATAAVALAGGILAIPASPAAAQDTSIAIRPDYWVNVSSNGTRTVNDNAVDTLVGLQRKATKNIVSRAYYHFDVSELAGKNILSANLLHQQIHSPNQECGLEAFGPGVEVGLTDPVNYATAWPGPAWRTTLDVDTYAHGDQAVCPGYRNTSWTVESGVEQAVVARQGSDITFGFRSGGEWNPDGFRKFANDTGYPVLVVQYNSTPDTPSEVGTFDPAVPCTPPTEEPALISSATPYLSARFTDEDSGSSMFGQFELYEGDGLVWSARTSTTVRPDTTERVRVPEQTLAHDHAYWFRVRAEEETDEGLLVSGWSQSCHFKVDISYPRPPSVASADYPECDEAGCTPHGGGGIPGEFTLSASDSDVVEYRYWLNGGDHLTARPAAPGEPVTVSITPDGPGVNTVHAEAVDGAGNVSVEIRYNFGVAP